MSFSNQTFGRRSPDRIWPGLLVLSLFAILASSRERTEAAEPDRPRRFIYNSDGGNIFIDKQPPMMPEDVYPYIDKVAGTQITSFFICPNWGMPLMYPGNVTEMIGSQMDADAWRETLKTGAKPESRGTRERGLSNLRGLMDAGHDPVGLIVDRARKKNLEVFITFRLNEIHDVQNPDSLIVSKFWREHPEWRVGKHGDEMLPLFKEIIGGSSNRPVNPIVASWFPGALNFAMPEVRMLRLAELRECCERYPIDGLDLDFQRFPIYFPQDEGPRHVAAMTDWVRSVREMTREVGEKRGRPLLLSARILARPAQNLGIGLDPAEWARQDLVDFLTVSHYLRNDFPLPMAEFRKILPATMPLYASIEVEPRTDTYRDIARRLWDEGVDGILLFNFFTARDKGDGTRTNLFNELGSPATIAATPAK